LALVVSDLRAAIEPCGAEFVIETLAPMLAVYGLGRKSSAEAEAFWAAYIDTLEGVPREALTAGVREYNSAATSEFFPKPGPLKAICERHAIPLRMAANRAQRALEAR
jgi:hypothetical protein